MKRPKFANRLSRGGGKGPGGALPPRDHTVTKAMFAEWMQHHRKRYPTELEEALRFDNFQRHAYLKKAHAHRIVSTTVNAGTDSVNIGKKYVLVFLVFLFFFVFFSLIVLTI